MTIAPPGPDVSVVIPYYEGQRRLDLVLAALELQDLGTDAFEVVVADDGSNEPPELGDRPYVVRSVGHADLGNRTGPARNLGARWASGNQLVFIDGDTVPEPAFLREILAASGGERLTVGLRRHADLSQIDPDGVRAWLTGDGPAPPQLEEPAWLADGWRSSDDLRRSDLRSYRFIISAVLACPRRLFDRVGGFAEELVGYGGEDWELARRCWLAGADLRHAPRAVGWHDGPDLAGRPEDVVAVKNGETMRIADLITDPHLRGTGLLWSHPRVVVRCAFTASTETSAIVALAEVALRFGDIGLWLGGHDLPLPDPRIHGGMPTAAVLGRAELVVDLTQPVELTPELIRDWLSSAPVSAGHASAASPRDLALGRSAREAPEAPRPIAAGVQLERRFGRLAS